MINQTFACSVNAGELISWLKFAWGWSSALKLAIMKDKLVSKRLQSLTES